jgi:hypothetical protein
MIPFWIDLPALPALAWLPFAAAGLTAFFLQTLLCGTRS